MRKKLMVAALGAVLSGVFVAGATVAYADQVAQATDPIAARKDNRKAAGAQMRAVKGVIDKPGAASEVTPMAAKLKELSLAHVKLYPRGSDKGETKALAAIWTDMKGFEAAAKAEADAIDRLSVAAGSGDIKQVAEAFGAIGRACAACHDKYRAK